MLSFGAFAFASPLLLTALAALPIIWFLLRVTPPAPRRIVFPPIRLLRGLIPREETPARTPWWLILLRMAIAALVIIATAYPLLNPRAEIAGTGPLVLVVDNGWAAAADWPARQAVLKGLLAEVGREGRHVMLVPTAATAAPPAPLTLMRAADARAAVEAMRPQPWPADRRAALARLKAAERPHADTAIWLSDGIAAPGGKTAGQSGAAALADYLAGRGSLRYLLAPPGEAPLLLSAGDTEAKELSVAVHTLPQLQPRRLELRASGADGRLLARQSVRIPAGARRALVRFDMPNALRNEVTRITIEGARSAGAVLLADEHWRRRPVGIVAPSGAGGQPLLSATYYLDRALAPFAEVHRGRLADLLKERLAVMIFAGAAPNSASEERALAKWVEAGGLLLRFAGPQFAAANDVLLPVRLRRGGRTIGGAMSWEKPARLARFGPKSPFAGLKIPDDVTVSRQVLAEPDLSLAGKIWARLADGTPLVTAARRGKGRIVLVHTTANANWSNLALSGLFVQMLRRIVAMSQGISGATAASLPPLETLDGLGRLQRAPATVRPIAGKEFAATTVSPRHPPGFYGTADARRALNLSHGMAPLTPIEDLPAGVAPQHFGKSREVDLRPPLLLAALLLALLDLSISYLLRGLLRPRRAGIAAVLLAGLTGTALSAVPGSARADDAFAIRATSKLHLAYVETGDPAVDAVSRAGLTGLSEVLTRRTAVEPAAPMGIDIERDDLLFFPLIYWPLTASEPPPSPKAVARINRYLETGGTILFDTRDGSGDSVGPFGSVAAASARLGRLTAGVKIPQLIPVPPNHVLTKSFYLMHEFPGRWNVGTLWVSPSEDEVNDGVSTVIVGADDWAGAWAVDADGRPLYPCVPGGEPQREMAYRFGVNLVMYVLTGNYKSDQVHVPAILERLGQ